jgi:hypothetical protein
VTAFGSPSPGVTGTGLIDTDGITPLGGASGGTTTFIEPVTASSTGTYTALVNPVGGGTGNLTLTVYDVPADLSGTITPGGSAVNAAMNTPGQNALYTVGTPTNARLSLSLSSGPPGSATVRASDGSTVTSTSITVTSKFIEPWTFASGQTIFVNPSVHQTGTVTLTLFDVPNDLSGTLTPGGGAVNVTLSPGQNASYTLGTPTNSRVSMSISGGSLGTVKVLDGSGGTVDSTTGVLGTFFEPWTFASGQTVSADLSGSGTGTRTLTPYDVPADTTGSLTVNGGPSA